jgi:hypothetical protein
VLAGYFLGAYVGLALPVLALGVATQFVAARAAMLVFVAFLSVTVVGSVRTLIEQRPDLGATKATSIATS